jgi:hypothetical protein
MKIKMQSLKRITYIVLALAVAVAGVVQGLSQRAYAFPIGGQLVDREITISSSRVSATSTSYRIAFLPFTDNLTVKGIIIDFCEGADTPIIGDSACDIPTTFTVGTPTVNTTTADTGYTALGNGDGTWTSSALNSGRTLKMENNGTNGVVLDAQNATRYMFTVSTVTNPSATGTFYARMILYDSAAGDIDSYAPGSEGNTNATDYGGIALSTVNVISITAKVQETLTFCVSKADPTAGCGGVTAPTLTLGHGVNEILDDTATDTDTAFMQASTNAQSGINVRMKNSNACGGLSRNAGTTCEIAAAGATAVNIAAGVSALFGLRLTDGSSALAAQAPYAHATNYGMDNSTSGNQVTSTYGSLISASTVPLDDIENTFTFAATATVTTPAGLYSADMTILAIGTF